MPAIVHLAYKISLGPSEGDAAGTCLADPFQRPWWKLVNQIPGNNVSLFYADGRVAYMPESHAPYRCKTSHRFQSTERVFTLGPFTRARGVSPNITWESDSLVVMFD